VTGKHLYGAWITGGPCGIQKIKALLAAEGFGVVQDTAHLPRRWQLVLHMSCLLIVPAHCRAYNCRTRA
jgi:hypothetical protein